MFPDFIQGFIIELTLIVAVGLQNAFILKQGIRKRHVFWAVAACFAGETLLVTIGVAGMGVILSSKPDLIKIILVAGICFLTFYSVKSFIAAFKADTKLETAVVEDKSTAFGVLTAGLGFALLNPHVIIDTTLMGALSTKFYPHQWIFWAGVVTAAMLWYSFLGILGKILAKPLNNPKIWRFINIAIGLLCAYMAFNFAINFNEPHEHEHGIINIPLLEQMHKHGNGE